MCSDFSFQAHKNQALCPLILVIRTYDLYDILEFYLQILCDNYLCCYFGPYSNKYVLTARMTFV